METLTFTKEVWSHYQPLLNFAFKFTKNTEDAEDLLQDTLVKAIRYETQFQSGTNLKSWLFTIMRNTFINNYRAKVRQREVITQEEDLTSIHLMASADLNRSEGKFIRDDIKRALLKVPERHRKAFVMYFEGHKYEEIAEKFGIPIGTVKTYIHCARGVLKKQLSQYKS